MATQKELDDFDSLFADDVKAVTEAKNGPYAQQIHELLHLSGQASADGTIAITSTETYSQLISLVERASQMNLSQAELKDRIVGLGTTAVSIAQKVGGLAAIL